MFGFGSYARPQSAFDYGQSGVTGNGMISNRDDAAIMEQLMNAQYQEALRRRNLGLPGMGDWQINNIKNEADRYAGIRATGQGTSFFTMPQYSTPWDKYNETARLDTSRSLDLDGIMRGILGNNYENRTGYNSGQRWAGLQPLTPAGTSFGGGINMDPGGGIVRNQSTTAPSDANRASAFSNPYNGGRPMGGGSYLGGPGGSIPNQPFGGAGTQNRPHFSMGYGTDNRGQLPGAPSYVRTGITPVRGYNPRMGEAPSGWNESGATGYPSPGSRSEGEMNRRLQEQQRLQQLYSPQELQGRFQAFGPAAMSFGSNALPMQFSDFNPRYMGPYSPQFYNNAMNSAAIYGGLLGTDRLPYSYQMPGQGVFGGEFNRRGF